MTPILGLAPSLDPEADPLRAVPTDRLLAELGRRSRVHCIALVEDQAVLGGVPGAIKSTPMFTWGSKTCLAHEALGLLAQMQLAVAVEAKSQFSLNGKDVDAHFAALANERRRATAVVPLDYTYQLPHPSIPNPGTNS